MKAKLECWLQEMSGTMSQTHYATPSPYEPGYVIIRRKPGPRNSPGQRKKLWEMSEAQAAPVRTFKANQATASAIYHDPVLRARYEQEYKDWLRQQQRHGKSGGLLKGKRVRFLWDYIRIKVNQTASSAPPVRIGS